ncbi:MAG: hypothetical protein IJV29_07080 [Butyrivibrio sp.]|nr:hypothetical protein [Butyrivibrio sp.]
MYATAIQDIENPILHDAALVLSLRENDKGEKIFKFRSLYMDKSGECAISYYGHLTEQQIKEVMINFCYPMEDKSYDAIHPTVWKDYEYMKGNSSERNPDYTTIYTPDGLDYRTLKI